MSPLMLALVASALLIVALPLLVYGLVPVRARSRRFDAPVTALPTSALTQAAAVAAENARDPFVRLLPTRPRLERQLALAGLTMSWPLARMARIKVVGTGVAVLFAALVVIPAPQPARLLFGAIVIVVAFLAPDAVVAGRARERQDAIQHDLPDALDQIIISIEAGLSLETAMARAGQYGKGPLAQELTRTVQDMRVGFSRKEAYTALSDRTSVVDLRRFARAVMQADQYGVSVGGVVRSQGAELRMKRRQRAEEKAMRIPVKVLFPLMVCILPVLFVVVLGPAVINLTSVLAGFGS